MTTALDLHLDDARPLTIAARLRWLSIPKDGAPTLSRRRPRRAAVGLEATDVAGGPALLLLRPADVSARVNGLPAPRLALLRPGDLLSVGTGPLLEVGVASRPAPATTAATCAVCREALDDDHARHACGCGRAFHTGPDLDCDGLLAACPGCGAELATPEGEGAPL